LIWKPPEGAIKGPKWACFCPEMIPGYGLCDGLLASPVPSCSPVKKQPVMKTIANRLWREPYSSQPNLHNRSPTALDNSRKIWQDNAKLGQNLTPSKPEFHHPVFMCTIIEADWWCLRDIPSSGLGAMSAYVCCLSQKQAIIRSWSPTLACKVAGFSPIFIRSMIL